MSKHSNHQLSLFFESTSLKMSVIVYCIGILVLYGWAFDITLFKSIRLNYIPMKPNSAAAFILCSLSLLLHASYQRSKHLISLIIGKFLGIMIVLFGLMILLDYVCGYHLHIEKFILEQPSAAVIFGHGMPSPLTGFTFFLIGLALILLRIKSTLYLSEMLYAAIGLVGLLMLTGFTYNLNMPSELVNYTYASMHSAICFILISLALLFSRPTQGIMILLISNTNGGSLARRLIPVMILLPILLGYFKILSEHYNIYDARTSMASYSMIITAILIIVTIFISKRLMKADIRRLHVESQLHKLNNELADLYNNAPCGYHSLDINGFFTQINTTELNWLGYTRAEVIGKLNVTDVMTPASRRIFHESFQKLNKRGQIQDYEFEFVRKNGSIFTVLLNATIVRDANGHFLMYRSTIFDINERKRIEQALRVSEEKFHNAMDTAPIGMAIVSLDGKYVEVNKALCQLVGYSKDELEQMTFQQITYPDDLAIDMANAQNLIEGKIRLHQVEKRYIRKDGNLIWVQLTASILRDAKTNNPLYFITQIEDITERKSIDEKIRQLAYYDSLTNLPNRRLLLDRLNQAIDLADRHQRILALLFLDLDKFKAVNDTLGHDVGDELLKVIAIRLNSALRIEDTVARISGDEFVIILNEISGAHDASIVAEKIINEMKNRFLLLGHELHIGCSIGITIYPQDATIISDLMKNADLAMYSAKESGRNQYRFYQNTPHTR